MNQNFIRLETLDGIWYVDRFMIVAIGPSRSHDISREMVRNIYIEGMPALLIKDTPDNMSKLI